MTTRKLGNEIMVVPSDSENRGRVLTLNPSGGYVWKLLEKERTFEELVELVMAEYGISAELAREDLGELLKVIGAYIE